MLRWRNCTRRGAGFSGLFLPVLEDAALALRLDKPLTARLMPIANKKAGDPSGFAFAFFANSKIMALESEALKDH